MIRKIWTSKKLLQRNSNETVYFRRNFIKIFIKNTIIILNKKLKEAFEKRKVYLKNYKKIKKGWKRRAREADAHSITL